ncbi:MAG: lipid A deacylase LpxR family protein [Pseudomonadota bacterium]
MYNLLIENDVFTGSDRHYTNGLRLSWLSAQEDVPDYIRRFADAMPFIRPNALLRAGYAIGHNIYTPNDISTTALVPDERPYAGYLYGGFAVVADAETILDTWALDLGIVGPSARGEEVQNGFHRLIGSPQAMGWSNQLRDEVTVSLTHERKWRHLWEHPESGYGADLTPHMGIGLGNLATYANAGLTLRVGEHLGRDFGPPRIRPSLPGSAFFAPSNKFSWYLYAGVDGRAVARNLLLDGNTWQTSHHVDSKTWVGDLQVGAVLTFPKFRLTYTHVFRSKEFDGQDSGDHFGALSLTAFF